VYNALESGASFGVLTGHGNPNLMVQLTFNNDHDEDGCVDYPDEETFWDINGHENPASQTGTNSFLTTYNPVSQTEKLGMYYLGGCSVGTFTNPDGDCLTEMMLKTCSIGVIGGSQLVWGEDEWYEREHGGWHSEGLQFRFFEQLIQNPRPGFALAEAKEDYVLDRANLAYAESPRHGSYLDMEEKCLKQNNLLGDPEVPIWMDIPKNMTITNMTTLDGLSLVINDGDSIDTPLENVTCTLTQGNTIVWKDSSDASGEILIPYNSTALEEYTLTVYEEGYLPQILLEYVPSTENPTDDDDDSNISIIPGFNPSLMICSSLFGISLIMLYHKKNK
jgi:hypothetical protein